MTGHPALQKALIKWSSSHPDSYNAVVWSLCGAAAAVLRPTGALAAGERQALFLRFDAILTGGQAGKKS